MYNFFLHEGIPSNLYFPLLLGGEPWVHSSNEKTPPLVVRGFVGDEMLPKLK